jgi:hypothetical protein
MKEAKTKSEYPLPQKDSILCGECRYQSVCGAMWKESDEITQLADVTPKIFQTKILPNSITTIKELAYSHNLDI